MCRSNKAEVTLLSINRNATAYYKKLLKTAKGRYNKGKTNYVKVYSSNGRGVIFTIKDRKIERGMSIVY